MDNILEAGRTAPTACNYQPQRIYVMKSEEALKKARGIRVSHFNAPLMILALKKMLKEKKIPVADNYFYAHMLHIKGRVEAAKEFGRRI